MDGILLINKPKGITSFKVVSQVRKELQTKKVGHAGTLDPFATGVLVILVGKATKLSDYLLTQDKEYIATSKIGASTDSLDEDGEIIATSTTSFSQEQLVSMFAKFTGEISQIPPKYSAIKVNGKKLYEYARNDIDVEIKSRNVKINEIELINFSEDKYVAKASVSKGTYIRTLFSDINHTLDAESHLIDLQRTKSGQFSIEECIELDEISSSRLISLSKILKQYYQFMQLTDEIDIKLAKNGNKLELNVDNDEVVITIANEIIGIFYRNSDNLFQPKIMF